MSYIVSEMTIEDYDQVLALWKSSPSIMLSKVDTRDCIDRFLSRNTGFSFVARDAGQCIGAILCSHDGRLGYLSHLVVREDRRREGIGRQLVGRCLYALTGMKIHSCLLLIMEETQEALQFFQNVDPAGRINLVMMEPRELKKVS